MSAKQATADVALRPVERAVAIEAVEFITAEQIELIKQTIMPEGTSELELNLFLNFCRAKRLDPLSKQIYAQKRSGKLQMFASIDGLRVIAQRTGEYGGQTAPYWCGPDGQWREIWLENAPPSGAKVGVYKRGFPHPTWGIATWNSYGKGKQNNWVSMPDVMLAKCAESIALRKAFPDDLSGLYVREEFQEDERVAREPMHAHTRLPREQREANLEALAPSPRVVEDDDIIDAETGEIVEADAEPDEDADLYIMDRDHLNKDIRGHRSVLGWTTNDVMQHAAKRGWNIGQNGPNDHLIALARDVRQMARELAG